ncbi:MAG TPA: hypothetical protein VD903_14085 [Pseudonocardia sp.]|nr:hypothetical protein [Pseudonocardia sp.]
MRSASLLAATLTSGLYAGLFYTFAVSVMLGLRRLDDRTFVDAMQQINLAVENGWFMGVFLGAPVPAALAAVLHLGPDHRQVLPGPRPGSCSPRRRWSSRSSSTSR